MNKRKEYIRPHIKTNDFLTRNGLMIEIGNGSTDMNLSKSYGEDTDMDTEDTSYSHHSVWED